MTAFEIVEQQAPRHAAVLAQQLDDSAIALLIGEETFSPRATAGKLEVTAVVAEPLVTIKVSLATMLRLFDAELSLYEALRSDDLLALGGVDQLKRAGAAFDVFLHGLVRSPRGGTLLAGLRAIVTGASHRYSSE